MRFPIPQTSDHVLFEATLEPTFPALRKLATQIDVGESEIGTVAGKKVRVAVGVPYYENLVSRFSAEKAELPHEIGEMLLGYDFHFASLSCSFLPDRDCKLVWARFGVELRSVSRSGESLSEKPVAWDVFPEEVLSQSTYERNVSFVAGFKLNLGVVNTDLIRGKANKVKEYFVYEPQIFAYGIRRSNVAWDFRSTKEKGIWGNKRDLLLVIRAPKNSKVMGRFLLGVEVEFEFGRPIRIPFARRDGAAVEVEHRLSE